MNSKAIGPTGLSYSQAYALSDWKELVFVSGQVPETGEGVVPESFDEQCRLAWHNVSLQLGQAGMSLENLVKVTIFLSDRKFREANAKIRHDILGGVSPALTVIIAGIYEEKWLLEIEAVAAR